MISDQGTYQILQKKYNIKSERSIIRSKPFLIKKKSEKITISSHQYLVFFLIRVPLYVA